MFEPGNRPGNEFADASRERFGNAPPQHLDTSIPVLDEHEQEDVMELDENDIEIIDDTQVIKRHVLPPPIPQEQDLTRVDEHIEDLTDDAIEETQETPRRSKEEMDLLDREVDTKRWSPQKPPEKIERNISTKDTKKFAATFVGQDLRDSRGGIYHVERVLGSGGMGFVLQAESKRNGMKCAIKFLAPGLKDSNQVVQRFEREINATVRASEKNPFILHVLDRIEVVVQGEPLVGFVSEVVEGPNLNEIIQSSQFEGVPGRMEPARASQIVAELAVALSALEREDLVHRDLKPANVYVETMHNNDVMVRLGDFGLVKEFNTSLWEDASASSSNQESSQSPSDLRANLTGAGLMLGTPRFMSPEQILGGATTKKTDLYALGVMFYTMLTGHHPQVEEGAFNDPRNLRSALISMARFPAKPFASVGAKTVPMELQALVFRMLAKNPVHRPESALEVYTKIKEWIAKDRPELLEKIAFTSSFDGKDQSYYDDLARQAEAERAKRRDVLSEPQQEIA